MRGFLDLKLEAEKTNSIKVLLFFDIGGSMDPYVRLTEQLFSAAKVNLNIWSIIIFIISFMNPCGRTIICV